MTLDFLDNGLSLEHGNEEVAKNEIEKFKQYCKQINKNPQELTDEELKQYYNSLNSD